MLASTRTHLHTGLAGSCCKASATGVGGLQRCLLGGSTVPRSSLGGSAQHGPLASEFWGSDIRKQNVFVAFPAFEKRRRGSTSVQAAKKKVKRVRKIVEVQEEASDVPAPKPKKTPVEPVPVAAPPQEATAAAPSQPPPTAPATPPQTTQAPRPPQVTVPTAKAPVPPKSTAAAPKPPSPVAPKTTPSVPKTTAPVAKTAVSAPPRDEGPAGARVAAPSPQPGPVPQAAPVQQGPPKKKLVTKYGFPLVKERISYSDLLKDGGKNVRAIYHLHDVRGDTGKIPFMESRADDLPEGVRLDGSRKNLSLLQNYIPEEEEVAEAPVRVLVALADGENVVRTTLPPVKYNPGFWKEFADARLQYKLVETIDPYKRAAERRVITEDTGADRAFAGEGDSENFRAFSFPIAIVLIVIIYQGIARLQKARQDKEERERVAQYQEQKRVLSEIADTLGYNVSIEEIEQMQKEFMNSSNEQLGLNTTGDDVADRKLREEASQNLSLVVGNRFKKSGAKKFDAADRKKSKYRQRTQPVTLEDVAGIDHLKDEVTDIVAMLKNPQKWLDRGIKIPSGIILFGPPGCGKTLLAKAIAGEAGFAFFSTSASQFVEVFAGIGAARIRDLYYDALINAPAIVFIDEIDAIGRKRGAVDSGGEERDQTLNQLLVSLDGFSGTGQVITICATNRIDALDRALTRPGRFDRKLCVEVPGFDDRIKILKVHTKNKPIASYINWYDLGGATAGMSGAGIANVVNLAVLESIRQGKEEITTMDLVNAARQESDGYKLDVHTAPVRHLGYAIECAAKIVMAMNTMDFTKITAMTMYKRDEGTDALEAARMDRMRMFMRHEGFGWHFDYISILLAPRAVDELYNGGLDNLSASSFLSTDEARTSARLIVQTGLVDPDMPSYDMNVLYPQHIWELQDVQMAVILEAAYKRCQAVLKENVTLINALAHAVMEEKVLLEERIHELADKYGKYEVRRPTIFRIRDARLELCDPEVRKLAPKIEEPWHGLNPQAWLEFRETHFNLMQTSLWDKMRQDRAIEENERAALSRRVQRVSAMREEGAAGGTAATSVMERGDGNGGERRRLDDRGSDGNGMGRSENGNGAGSENGNGASDGR